MPDLCSSQCMASSACLQRNGSTEHPIELDEVMTSRLIAARKGYLRLCSVQRAELSVLVT